MLKFYNTLPRKKEIFRSIKGKKVGLYTCGPTVYDVPHIGNLRCYIFEDILKRVLLFSDYKVKHVMNITDVGHLTSDADTGEDKVEKSAKEKRKSPYEIATFYTQIFKDNLKKLNIIEPDIWCKATEHIKEQINLIRKLEKEGFTYKIDNGIYFDTSKLPAYGKLARLDIKGLRAGARIKMVKGKKNITDFALWKFSPKDKKRLMEWSSPWGIGFPGWHLECAAMSIKYLGIPFDIHCGGVEHIPIHHTNEIAEAEGASGKKFVNFWLHCHHLKVEGKKMAKSLGNFITLEQIIKRGFSPLAFRYFSLLAHYRSSLNFTWEALWAAQNAIDKLYETISGFKQKTKEVPKRPVNKFKKLINDDLDTPSALSFMWDIVKRKFDDKIKLAFLLKIDEVLGLEMKEKWQETREIPKEILIFAREREGYRREKKWKEADKIRKKIKKMSYLIEDTKEGPRIKKKEIH